MICARCKVDRSVLTFYVRPDGSTRKPCSVCILAKNAEYRASHREEIREQKRRANEINPEVNRARVRAWQKANPERVNACQRRLRRTPEAAAKRHLHYLENRARINIANTKRHLARLKTDPEYRFLTRTRTRVYQALSGFRKGAKTVELLGAPIRDVRDYIASKFKPGMRWDNWGEWHIDHEKPCNTFDLSDPDQQKICFHYTNLRPLWKADNLQRPKDGSDLIVCPTQL